MNLLDKLRTGIAIGLGAAAFSFMPQQVYADDESSVLSYLARKAAKEGNAELARYYSTFAIQAAEQEAKKKAKAELKQQQLKEQLEREKAKREEDRKVVLTFDEKRDTEVRKKDRRYSTAFLETCDEDNSGGINPSELKGRSNIFSISETPRIKVMSNIIGRKNEPCVIELYRELGKPPIATCKASITKEDALVSGAFIFDKKEPEYAGKYTIIFRVGENDIEDCYQITMLP